MLIWNRVLRGRRTGRWVGLALAAVLLSAAPAFANGIDPLVGLTRPIAKDAVLVSGNGIQFTTFEFYAHGPIDAAQFQALNISATATGLEISGLLSAVDGAEVEFYMSYQATATGAAVNGVTLGAVTSVVDGGFPTFAKAGKTLIGPGGTLAGVITSNFQGLIIDSDTASFAPTTTFMVWEGIRLSSGGPGGSAEVTLLTNSFAVVPEPMSSVLLGLGLMGLALAGRHRS